MLPIIFICFICIGLLRRTVTLAMSIGSAVVLFTSKNNFTQSASPLIGSESRAPNNMLDILPSSSGQADAIKVQEKVNNTRSTLQGKE